jgi:hypothetical protein
MKGICNTNIGNGKCIHMFAGKREEKRPLRETGIERRTLLK